MSESGKVFRGAFSQTAVVTIIGILGLVYFSIMSRLLTKEDFGYYAIISAITGILAEVSNAGLGAAIIQRKYPDALFVSTAFSLSLCLGVIFSVLLFIFSPLLSKLLIESDYLSLPLHVVSVTLLLTSLNSVGRAIILRKLQFLKFGTYEICAFTISSLLGIYFAYTGYGVMSIIAAVVLNQFIITLILYGLSGFRPHLLIKRKYVHEILSFGGWLTGSSIIRSIYGQLDKLITTHWIPVVALGAYNRPSYFVGEVGGKIFGIFDTILFPILSSIQDDKTKIAAAFEKSTTLLIQLSLILSFSLILASEFLIELFFGHDWLDLVSIFNILCLILIFDSFNRLTDCFFRSLGIVKKYFFVRVLVCISSALFILVGCQFGILGLAVGFGLSRLTENIIKIIYLSPHINIPIYSTIKAIIKNNAIFSFLFFAIYLIPFNGMKGSAFASMLYIFLLVSVACFFPKAFGNLFYTHIYKKLYPIVSKFIKIF